MSLDLMRAYLEARLKASMDAQSPAVGVMFENTRFTPTPNAIYVAMHIMEGDAFKANLGSVAKERHVGVIQVDIMTPEGTGTGKRNRLSKTIGDLLGYLRVSLGATSDLKTFTPVAKSLGNLGLYDRMAISITYHRDDDVTIPI